MIKPPFTILILKNAHHPVTLRITVFSCIILLTVIPAFFCMAGIGLSFLFTRGHAGSHAAVSGNPTPQNTSSVLSKPGAAGSDEASSAGIEGLFASFKAGGDMEISFIPIHVPPAEICYIWVILNPGGGPGEMVIHPRSPVFRGIPVDFRNGISFLAAQEKKCTIVIESIPEGLLVTRIRILMYSSEGGMLADKQFNIGQDARK